MTGRGSVLRLAQVLINEACQRLPADARQDREREWAAELAAIIDDPDIRRRWRRHLRALRFAVAQRRTVRRLTWPAGAARVRVIVARTALASAGAAVVLAVAMIPLDSVVTSSSSYSYPALQAEALAGTLALAAGLLCAMLLASLGLARTMRSLRPRRPAAHAAARPAARVARTARMARGGVHFRGAGLHGRGRRRDAVRRRPQSVCHRLRVRRRRFAIRHGRAGVPGPGGRPGQRGCHEPALAPAPADPGSRRSPPKSARPGEPGRRTSALTAPSAAPARRLLPAVPALSA